jgi:hypothetical protein
MDRRMQKLLNEELRDLFFSPKNISVIQSRKMRWAGLVACIRERSMHLGLWRAEPVKMSLSAPCKHIRGLVA